jgi:hypothetical protein
MSPALAISGVTECISSNKMLSAERRVAYPIANAWLSGTSETFAGEIVLAVNLSETPATEHVCGASTGYYELPVGSDGRSRLHPICGIEFEVQIAPFNAPRFPIEGPPGSKFLLETQGAQMVLQVLKPLNVSVQLYSVDSRIRFDEERPVPSGSKR